MHLRWNHWKHLQVGLGKMQHFCGSGNGSKLPLQQTEGPATQLTSCMTVAECHQLKKSELQGENRFFIYLITQYYLMGTVVCI